MNKTTKINLTKEELKREIIAGISMSNLWLRKTNINLAKGS